jgi:uncharacterized membrane protein YphA (DoxX/SURF4 family)
MALLLLRAVFSLVILAEGRFCVGEPDSAPATWLMGLSAFAVGGLLLIGFLTPIVGAVVVAGALGAMLSLLPKCSPTLFDSSISVIFGLTMLVTIIGLGPGAFSVDARVFGRREIIIPTRVSQSQE